MEPDITPISLQDTFCFSCNPQVPCFNECCRDLNQLLTPYDILRLKNHLGLTSGQFLAQYASQHTGPETGLPIISLKTADQQTLNCPFVSPEGCRVYEHRPSSCRIYPLMRGVSRCRETGRVVEQFMVLKEPHCCGFAYGEARTVQQWIDGQELAVYNDTNDRMLELISLKNMTRPGVLDIKDRLLFFTALYDLDGFRAQIAGSGLLDGLKLDPSLVDRALVDDVALLEVGIQWVAQVLFGQE